MNAEVNRLPAPAGLLLDRDRPVGFSFESTRYRGLAGDTLASALAANDTWILSRSFKYHRPRGILTMSGQDANTLVQLSDEPNVPADRLAIEEGLEAFGQNYSGSLIRDRDAFMGRLGRFMPVGFYYRAFFKPRGIWEKFWEPLVRRKAGLGRVDLKSSASYFDKAYEFCDIAVIGGGPAGLSAALASAEAGADVLLVDENPVLGGSLTYARFDIEGTLADNRRAQLVAAVETQPSIKVMTDAVCNGWFADNWLPVIRGNRLHKVRARQAILATGSIEQPMIFRNNDLPGVMQGTAAQRLTRLYGVRPGKRAVVLTANAHGYGVALDLIEAGVEVATVADLRPTLGDSAMAEAVAARGVPVMTAQRISAAVAGPGNRHVAGALLCPVDATDKVTRKTQCRVECDLICMSPGYTPTFQLALQAGGQLEYDDDDAYFSITNLPDGLRLAGSVDGIFDLKAVLAAGRRAGWQAARDLGFDSETEPMPPEAGRPDVNHAWPIFPHKDGMEFVDFDEDLQVADILNAVAEGYGELELVKRFSTVGMGVSQGRHSALATARLVARETGRRVSDIGVTTARPPVMGEKLGVLAGRNLEPQRLTTMHHRHLEQDAQMMTVGQWWRPAYYGPKTNREAEIRAEVLAVRTNVGIIDVSTLGGLEVRGPDAAEFLERMYTFAYKKQPCGRARYVLMTNDAGTVIDDGVACRFRDDHYYVTATTGGVDRVYRDMLWCALQWNLDVDVANITSAYAGINIAGPNSRIVLQDFVEDVDLSTEAFPYMGLREGRVAGIPARLIRVGFVGELGYELHVPSSCGEALWDLLIEAGKSHEIRPFGVEAQRILRLEKGHIIIGQDTDAMTTPDEVGMTWAVSKNKPFFVGGRSIELRRRYPSKRKLVGFNLSDTDAPLPEESNLVLRSDEMVGFVTSVARSPALGQVIGLAYTAADEAEPGQPLSIKLSSGQMVEGNIVAPHFYDPDNLRQEM